MLVILVISVVALFVTNCLFHLKQANLFRKTSDLYGQIYSLEQSFDKLENLFRVRTSRIEQDVSELRYLTRRLSKRSNKTDC